MTVVVAFLEVQKKFVVLGLLRTEGNASDEGKGLCT